MPANLTPRDAYDLALSPRLVFESAAKSIVLNARSSARRPTHMASQDHAINHHDGHMPERRVVLAYGEQCRCRRQLSHPEPSPSIDSSHAWVAGRTRTPVAYMTYEIKDSA